MLGEKAFGFRNLSTSYAPSPYICYLSLGHMAGSLGEKIHGSWLSSGDNNLPAWIVHGMFQESCQRECQIERPCTFLITSNFPIFKYTISWLANPPHEPFSLLASAVMTMFPQVPSFSAQSLSSLQVWLPSRPSMR